MGEQIIERLDRSARPALLDVFTKAFVEQVFMLPSASVTSSINVPLPELPAVYTTVSAVAPDVIVQLPEPLMLHAYE